ncbi:MAG: 5-formyltetrahydrofolate cyclo-ligase [Chitinophagaceae bacterium]|nr:5-formyltetrahydrofolate cyclo-ligase [Chitinophagaceae bacterium]
MTKKEIRKIQLEKRIQLSSKELQDNTALITSQFKTRVYPSLEFLLSYYPLLEKNEFNVAICEQAIIESRPSVKIAWPKIMFNRDVMEAHLIDKNKLFIKNKFNILEPLDGDVVPPESLDIVFVPLLAFDKKGFRVGYGKGFYDRYLPACRDDAVKIGFSFFEAVHKIDDINEFDVPLNLCITPTCIYEF